MNAEQLQQKVQRAKTLHDIQDEYMAAYKDIAAVMEEVEIAGGEITAEQEKQINLIELTLWGLGPERLEKFDATWAVIKRMELLAKEDAEVIAGLQRRKRAWTKTAVRLKDRLLGDLQLHEEKRIDTVHYRIRRQLSPAKIRPADPDNILDIFQKIIPEQIEFDVDEARKYLNGHGLMPTELGEHEISNLVVTRSEHLRGK